MPATRSRLGVIFLTVLIDLIGFGIVMPILPVFAQRFGAQGIGYGALVFVFSAMQFLATALLGRLSDRIGRRPILLTTMVINALRSEEHTSELQSLAYLVCRLLLEKKK